MTISQRIAAENAHRIKSGQAYVNDNEKHKPFMEVVR